MTETLETVNHSLNYSTDQIICDFITFNRFVGRCFSFPLQYYPWFRVNLTATVTAITNLKFFVFFFFFLKKLQHYAVNVVFIIAVVGAIGPVFSFAQNLSAIHYI